MKTNGLLPTLAGVLLAGWGGRLTAQAGGEVFRDCDVCPAMVVPHGSFMMGSPDSEAGRDSDEGSQRRVTIAHRFTVGVYEATHEG